MRRMKGLGALALLWVMSFPAMAQPDLSGNRGGLAAAPAGSRGAKQRVRMRVLTGRVGLDDASAHKVLAVLRAHEGKRAELARRMKSEKRNLKRLVRQDSNDEASYRRAIDDLMRTQQEMEALRFQEFTELRKVMTAKQQAKLLVELNRLMKRRQQRARRSPARRGLGPNLPGRQ